ncbi:MAG: hypothetical protein K2K70_07580 [Lachnospiraceae bacterium]|nr:hypothetical protein [Lachnospiraceae bacterium]
MRKKIGTTGMWLFLGLTIAFQIAYYIGLRDMISNERVFGTTTREVADHFVCCVGLVHYFLFGYLYSVKKHYAEKNLDGKNLDGKNGIIKRWIILEIFCQLGIFFSYFLVWIDSRIVYHINETIGYWHVGRSIQALYIFWGRKEIIPMGTAWVEQYGEIFDLTLIIAPVLLMLLIYSIHCVFRFIQFKRNDCFNMIWAVWTVVFFLVIIVFAVKWTLKGDGIMMWTESVW